MLWFMRRPWMKRLQLASTRWRGPEHERAMRDSLARQNAFARKIGLTIVTISINLLVGSVMILGAISAAMELRDSGLLSVPERNTSVSAR